MSSGTTRGHDAYRSIVEATRRGLYKPGDALREEEVAELEGIVARFAAHHATEAEIMHLRQLNHAFRNAGTAAAAYEHNRSFHTQLYDACRNRYLRQTVEDLQDTIAILPETTFKDGPMAQQLAMDHIRASPAVRLELIREQKQGDTDTRRAL